VRNSYQFFERQDRHMVIAAALSWCGSYESRLIANCFRDRHCSQRTFGESHNHLVDSASFAYRCIIHARPATAKLSFPERPDRRFTSAFQRRRMPLSVSLILSLAPPTFSAPAGMLATALPDRGRDVADEDVGGWRAAIDRREYRSATDYSLPGGRECGAVTAAGRHVLVGYAAAMVVNARSPCGCRGAA